MVRRRTNGERDSIAELSEEEYRRIQPEINQENQEQLLTISGGASLFFLFLLILSIVDHENRSYITLYAAMMLVSAFVFFYVRSGRRKSTKAVSYTVLVMLSVLVLYGGLHGTFLNPEGTAGIFFAILLAIPLLFIGRPERGNRFIIAAVLIFLVFAILFDTPEYAMIDGFSAGGFGCLSIYLNNRISRMRIQRLMDRQELADLTERDFLTGLKNRNSFDEAYFHYPEQCRENLACIYFDTNGLHELNNEKGHAAGDEMLITVAGAIREAFGDADSYRTGGDEFVAFARDLPSETICSKIHAIRQQLEPKSYHISAGFAQAEKDHLDISQLILKAEQKMYADKRDFYQRTGNDRRCRNEEELQNLICMVNQSETPIAIYEFTDGKVKTLCISDGLFEMMHRKDELDKASLIERFDTDMYCEVLPEDAARISAEALRFAREGGRYDVLYRERKFGSSDYSLTHAFGFHHNLKDGSRIAIITYADVNETICSHLISEQKADDSLRSFLDQSDLAMSVISRTDGELLYCNQPMRSLMKPVRNFDTGITISEFVTGVSDDSLLNSIASMADTGIRSIRFRKEDKPMPIRVSARIWEGKDVYFVQSEPWEELRHDSLTGLPNLSCFRSKAAECMNQIRSNGRTPAFLYFDLYGMKGYNAKFGIQEGDQILKRTAEILKKVFSGSLVSRLAEDHFIVLTDADHLEPRLRKASEEVRRSSRSAFLELKAGIYAEERPEDFSSSDSYVSTACDDARIACDSIRKDAGKSWAFFSGSVSEAYNHKLYVLSEFHRALEEHLIKVFYQPVYDLSAGKLAGYECLARWKDPEKGMLSPAEFIPVLEEHHLISALDQYMLKEICREAEERKQKGIGMVPISFNVSRDDFSSIDVAAVICEIADSYHIPHELLVAEITESAFSADPEYISAQAERIHNAGFQIWMDDFGSGYSSLVMLQSMQVDLVKLDMGFLQTYEQEKKNGKGEHSAAMLQAVIRLANTLGLHTLCEGAETSEHVDLLKHAGCEYVQGYYLGKPSPLSAISPQA
ncbi:EAL domain-containing protein [Anaerolactibacter massiliensis]|uniref:bifunctional diguanylate cyclase/phosphodiesterase n=1 Tax=Anaerolactibacter massiliensis TaxID=2044573 RepID=UPI000CF8F300|nr:EAL domain-containing protein [Anaerolactibacter massiliensis]